ncbi:MAG: diguanylate cyclase [Acidobacteriia bacterium]|nr:diguanylate cyclase [Terriglobia bacterium]
MSAIQDPEIYRTVLESMQTGVCVVDLENKILLWNDGAERITGYLRHEVMGRSCQENFQQHCSHRKCESCAERCPLAAAVHNARPVEASAFLHHKAGHRTPVHIWAAPVRDQHGSIIGAAQSFERLRAASSASGGLRTGDHTWLDEATGVANHAMMQSHLREALSTFTEMQVPFGVICVRLDEVEGLRAKYGQEAVYSILRVVAQTLECALRPTDYVGHWSEDQFLAILTGCSEVGLPAVCERVHKMIASGSIEWWGGEVFAGMIAMGKAFPQSGDSVETLVARVRQSLAEACNSQPADWAAVASTREEPKG